MSIDIVNSTTNPEQSFPKDHRVVVFGTHDDPESLAQTLTTSDEFDLVSARHIVRSLPGIIPRDLSRATAAAISTAVRELGLHAVAIPVEETPSFLHAERFHHLQVSDDGLKVIHDIDSDAVWPWTAVSVISVGVVPSDGPSRHRSPPTLAQGSFHKSWTDGVTIAPKMRAEAFVVLTGDTPPFIFASDEMNYEYLGVRMLGSSSANFRMLIKDLLSHAPTAWVTPSTRAFVDRGPVRHYEFRTRDDFRSYTEFQKLLSDLC